MINRFVCSDLHFSHKNMAIKRGFKTIEEHDQLIIDNWNSVVKKNDIVYLLGDISMEKRAPYALLEKLHGIIYVTLGNHDRLQDTPYLLNYVNGVSSCFEYKGYILTHIPIHPSEMDRFRGNIHGHLHDKIILDDRYINVSLERINYTPINLELIIK